MAVGDEVALTQVSELKIDTSEDVGLRKLRLSKLKLKLLLESLLPVTPPSSCDKRNRAVDGPRLGP